MGRFAGCDSGADGKAAAVMFGFAVYMTVIIPTLRTIVTPLEEETRTERIQALQLLSAGNVILMGCFGMVLLLQVGG